MKSEDGPFNGHRQHNDPDTQGSHENYERGDGHDSHERYGGLGDARGRTDIRSKNERNERNEPQ